MQTQNGTVDLNARINNPDTAAAIDRLLYRIDELEQTVNTITNMIQDAPGFVAMAGDVVDGAYRDAANRGIDLEERAVTGLRLLEKLTEPKTSAQAQKLLELADQMPGMAAMLGDIVDDACRSITESGIDIEGTLRQGAGAASKLSSLMSSEEFNSLMESGVLDPKALTIVGSAAQALVESQEKPPQKLGLIGLIGALRDADIQKALGFTMTFAKAFGKKI